MDDKNVKAIHQFLLNHNFESTAKTLIQEASKMGFQNLEGKLGAVTDIYTQLMLCYDTGDYSKFFHLWSDLFSDGIKDCNEYKKLTFYLHVHFAILHKRKLYAHQYEEHKVTSSGINTPRMSAMKGDSTLKTYKENYTTEIEKNMNDSMKQLQDYLNGDGKEFKYDTELQPFYVLPFIEDLHDPFFSKILEQDWLDELSRKLDLFIIDHRQDLADLSNIKCDEKSIQLHTTVPTTKTKSAELDITQNRVISTPIVPNDRDIPIFAGDNDNEEQCNFPYRTIRNRKSKITQTYITGNQIAINSSQTNRLDQEENNILKMHQQDRRLIQYNQELALTKTHLYSTRTNYEKLKLRFHKLHADYHKLIDVAGELTVALESSVKGQTIDIQRTLEICMKIFPDLFKQNIRETSYPSLLQLNHTDIKATALPILDVTATPTPPKLLDFKKIKLHLLNGDVKTKLLLLQALRWKITLIQSAEQDEILHEYISNDLLGLHGQIATDNGKPVLPCLLTAGEAYARQLLQQFTARLLNTLASFRCGRDYLSVGSVVVNVAFACLDNNYADGMDPFACDMMLAMLQKLSLRRQQRIYMIESGLLEWLINHLYDKSRAMSSYRLEYATALLMNLSLHRLAQARASKISSLLVSTFLILLSIDHASSLPYVNGALNNFLNNPMIYEEARKMNSSDMSDYFSHNQKSTDIRKHLDHVLSIQRRGNINTPQNEETVDDDNEELDVLENELDENDPLKDYVGELNGETLLTVCYSVSSRIPQEDIITNTTSQKIAALNPVEFYSNQHNHQCSNRSSHSALRYNVKKKNKILPKQIYVNQVAFQSPHSIHVSDLSDSSLKEQKIAIDIMNKGSLATDKVESITKDLVMPSLIMKYGSLIHERSENWTGVEKLLDRESKMKLECELPSKKVKTFKRNTIEKTALNDTVYLYENQTSKGSSQTAVISSMNFISDCENDQAEMEKLSSIASICAFGNSAVYRNTVHYDSKIINDTSRVDNPKLAEEEEAFLAKPKISRTPPLL